MKIKDMYIVNVFFLFFAFAYHLLSGVSGLGVLLMSLLAPQIIAFMPLFFYSRLGGMMEACGAKKIRDIEVKPMFGVLVIVVSILVLFVVYNSFLQFSPDGFFESGLLITIFISNAMGFSVAALLAFIVCYVI